MSDPHSNGLHAATKSPPYPVALGTQAQEFLSPGKAGSDGDAAAAQAGIVIATAHFVSPAAMSDLICPLSTRNALTRTPCPLELVSCSIVRRARVRWGDLFSTMSTATLTATVPGAAATASESIPLAPLRPVASSSSAPHKNAPTLAPPTPAGRDEPSRSVSASRSELPSAVAAQTNQAETSSNL